MEIIKKGSKINEELSQLLIFDAIENKEGIKQRDISKKTGLNLFKVNFLLRKMIEKGYVKCRNVYKNPNKRSYLYWLTPKGFKEKTRLIYRFVKVTLENYNVLEERITDNCENFKKSGIKRIILLGSDSILNVFERVTRKYSIEILGIILYDNKENFSSQLRIISKEDLKNINYDKIVVLSFDSSDEFESKIKDYGIGRNKIHYLK